LSGRRGSGTPNFAGGAISGASAQKRVRFTEGGIGGKREGSAVSRHWKGGKKWESVEKSGALLGQGQLAVEGMEQKKG